MSETPTQTPPQAPPSQPKRRSRRSRFLEFLFWIALSFLVAWLMIQNIESILPANSF